MEQLAALVEGIRLEPIAVLDIALTAFLIYGLFSLIQGTRAVRLVIGAILLYLLYAMAQALDLRLLSGIMQTGAVVGLLALVVIFQPELRRALDRIGRVGTLGWAFGGAGISDPTNRRIARTLAHAANVLSGQRQGGLIVIERETGLGDMAETGVRLDAELSIELLTTIFAPRASLHDGAVIVAGERVVAAAVTLPLAEDMPTRERYGTRHRAAVGVTEQTDAVAIVISEESGAISLVVGGSILRSADEEGLTQRLYALLRPGDVPSRARSVAALGGRTLRGKRMRGLRQRRPLPAGATPVVSVGADQGPASGHASSRSE
jgi:diadenylate cyclase